MSESIMSLHYDVCADDFKAAGEASSDVKNKLKVMGFPPDIVRRVAIAMYEGEINMVIHANGGEITVADQEPHGAIFTFSIPAGEVELHE